MGGKFVLRNSGDQFFFNLKAGNHEVILTGELVLRAANHDALGTSEI